MAEKAGKTPDNGQSEGYWSELPEDQYYAQVLTEIFADIEQARSGERPNYAALAALRSRAQDARQQLDAARKALANRQEQESDPYADAADADLEAILVETIAELPVGVIVRLQAAIDARVAMAVDTVDDEEAA